jgi:hypothetical protein
MLTARGFAIPAELRERVLACADVALLDAWIDRAVTADGIETVFAEEAGSGEAQVLKNSAGRGS